MQKITFDSHDKFNRKAFADRLIKIFKTFYPFYDGSYVLSLNASFGSGKSTFLHMWKAYLEEQHFKVVYINAWDSDFDDEPLLPIATSLLDQIGQQEDSAKKATKSLRGIIGVTTLIGNSALEKLTGINAKEILTAVEEDLKYGTLQKLGEDLSKAFAIKQSIFKNLHDCLSAYLESLPQKPLIVLIDELDRVRPDYAIKFLETIKHIFSVQGMCFVLAVDRKQLEASVKQLYGNIDFNNYYGRFVTREANLVTAKNINWSEFITKLSMEYFDRKEFKKISFLINSSQKKELNEYAAVICHAFHLTPRQAEHLFRVFAQFVYIEGDNKRLAVRDPWLRMALFLISLFISGNDDIYHGLGKGDLSPSQLYEFICTLSFSKDREKMHMTHEAFAFMLTQSKSLIQRQAVLLLTEKFELSNTENALAQLLDRLAHTVNSFGSIPDTDSAFQEMYDRLEEWKDFLAPDGTA